jgi:hypothetical protein
MSSPVIRSTVGARRAETRAPARTPPERPRRGTSVTVGLRHAVERARIALDIPVFLAWLALYTRRLDARA